MVDTSPPDEFTDVNDAVGEEWEHETTPYERVREVISHTYSPVSADTVADDARTTPKTARKHLESLADEGFVTTTTGEHGATLYRRSSESLVVEEASDILEEMAVDDLVARISEMRETIAEYQREYGVESPEELTVEQANRTLTEEEAPDVEADDVREWQRVRRNLAFANAALSIANAERFVGGDADATDGSVPVQ